MPDLSNAQVLSILNAMLVEQQTLSELWGQFSVAVKQVSVVITRYDEVSKLLPGLEKSRTTIQTEISSLEPTLENRKRLVAEEVERHRAALETELDSLRNSVTGARASLDSARNDLSNLEKVVADRAVVLAKETEAAESRLASIKQAFELFKQKFA